VMSNRFAVLHYYRLLKFLKITEAFSQRRKSWEAVRGKEAFVHREEILGEHAFCPYQFIGCEDVGDESFFLPKPRNDTTGCLFLKSLGQADLPHSLLTPPERFPISVSS